MVYGAAVSSVFVTVMSAWAAAVLPSVSELLPVLGSFSTAVAEAVLSNAPAALIVAVTVMFVFAPEARLAIVQGENDAHAPLTFVIVRFDGVSVTVMFVAVDGPAFATLIVKVTELSA